jgi:hypothetical protein
MAHRLAPQVEVELDEVWYYIARDSGSMEIADRLITEERKRRKAWNPPRMPAPCNALSELRGSRTRPALVVKR